MFLFGKKTVEKGSTFISDHILEERTEDHKKMYIVVYNGDDETCYKNAADLKRKYGEELTGRKLQIEKKEYKEGRKTKYVIKFYIEKKKIGVIFDDSYYYKKVMNGKLESIYAKIVQENIVNGKGKITSRNKVELYVK